MCPSFNPLFCTAPGLASKVNELLHFAQNTRFLPENNFSLMQSPSQEHFDKPTNPPVPEFETGFRDWSIEQLGAWCKERFDGEDPKPQPTHIEAEAFAVLDERTLRDGTVLLTKYDCWRERIDPNDPNDRPEAWRNLEGWRHFRVEMKEAPFTMYGLPEMFLSDFMNSMKPEDDGVMYLKAY